MWQPSLGTSTLQGCSARRLPGLVCISYRDMVCQELTLFSVDPPQPRSSYQAAAVGCLAIEQIELHGEPWQGRKSSREQAGNFRDKILQGDLGPLTLSPESPPFFRVLTFCLITPGACGPHFPYSRHRQSTSQTGRGKTKKNSSEVSGVKNLTPDTGVLFFHKAKHAQWVAIQVPFPFFLGPVKTGIFKWTLEGLSWWLRGEESACQRRKPGSITDPGRSRVPRSSSACEPQLLSLCSGARALQQKYHNKKPMHCH